jgi:hypothetical protein
MGTGLGCRCIGRISIVDVEVGGEGIGLVKIYKQNTIRAVLSIKRPKMPPCTIPG